VARLCEYRPPPARRAFLYHRRRGEFCTAPVTRLGRNKLARQKHSAQAPACSARQVHRARTRTWEDVGSRRRAAGVGVHAVPPDVAHAVDTRPRLESASRGLPRAARRARDDEVVFAADWRPNCARLRGYGHVICRRTVHARRLHYRPDVTAGACPLACIKAALLCSGATRNRTSLLTTPSRPSALTITPWSVRLLELLVLHAHHADLGFLLLRALSSLPLPAPSRLSSPPSSRSSWPSSAASLPYVPSRAVLLHDAYARSAGADRHRRLHPLPHLLRLLPWRPPAQDGQEPWRRLLSALRGRRTLAYCAPLNDVYPRL
jgi:hypothetical protein